MTGILAVALLAGGRSSRMGQDKARLRSRDGRELWQDRLALLRETGLEEVMISCREDQDYLGECGVRLVHDQWKDAGPLGGIVSCLEACRAEALLVLAVDLPGMTLKGLSALTAAAGRDPLPSGNGMPSGAVFRSGGFLEPLAAVYPRTMAETGRRRLEAGDLALKDWIAEGGAAGLMKVLEAPEESSGWFRNVNDPEAWARWLGEPESIPATAQAAGIPVSG